MKGAGCLLALGLVLTAGTAPAQEPVQQGHLSTANLPATIGDGANQALLMGCVLHTLGLSPIDQGNAERLAAAQIVLGGDAPPHIANYAPKGFGRSVLAHIASGQGPVWIVAFPETHRCTIFAAGGNVKNTAELLIKHVEEPGVPWRHITTDDDGTTTVRMYAWQVDANRRIRAAITTPSNLERPGKPLVMVLTGIDTGN